MYFTGDKVVVIDNAGQSFVVSAKADTDSLVGILNEITGISRLVNAEVNVKTGIKSALAFTSLIDVTRKHALGQ
ncbi:hypothetical protein [Phosphitispora sp. TUW77]|uniref:hypothetical protein n=1 Tax=Phosphitispora sp. TUW77 TaxID=3152361 RepID=UPI003AB81670